MLAEMFLQNDYGKGRWKTEVLKKIDRDMISQNRIHLKMEDSWDIRTWMIAGKEDEKEVSSRKHLYSTKTL